MKAIDLYKFVTQNNIEYHWVNVFNMQPKWEEDVIMFVTLFDIDEFYQLLMPSSIFDDDGIKCRMKDGYFAFCMKEICEYFDIDMGEIFERKN